MSVHEEGSAFDSWYNGLVGFHINSERILDDLDVHYSDAAIVERWMKVCWNSALTALEAKTWDFYWKNEKAGEDLDYTIESLKA